MGATVVDEVFVCTYKMTLFGEFSAERHAENDFWTGACSIFSNEQGAHEPLTETDE